MKWFIKCLRNYANFGGRARRKEFWYFILFVVLITIPFELGAELVGDSGPQWPVYLDYLVQIVFIIPVLSVGARRMHDIDKSGWFQLIPIYSLILACTEGTKGPNEYGPDPKDEVGENVVA